MIYWLHTNFAPLSTRYITRKMHPLSSKLLVRGCILRAVHLVATQEKSSRDGGTHFARLITTKYDSSNNHQWIYADDSDDILFIIYIINKVIRESKYYDILIGGKNVRMQMVQSQLNEVSY